MPFWFYPYNIVYGRFSKMSEEFDPLNDSDILADIKLEDPSESESSSAKPELQLNEPEENDFKDLHVPAPKFHPPAAPPFCHRCRKYDNEEYFSRQCRLCEQNLKTASIPQLFAILRQWASDVQKDCLFYIQQVSVIDDWFKMI